jgi:putative hydrolase of the HAD superfamily
MNAYIEEHLRLPEAAADRLRDEYRVRYGATLAGLVRHHNVDLHHFLAQTHAFIEGEEGLAHLRGEGRLAYLLRRLPGRKLLLTNAPQRYAQRVVRHFGAHRVLHGSYSIETMHVHGRLRPKPSRAMLRRVLARERIHPTSAILVEDNLDNLKSARALGMGTVLVTGYRRAGASFRKSRPPCVDLQVKSIAQLVKNQGRLR